MDKTEALQNLLKNKATQEEIELLKQALASGEISIGGNVNQSVIIIGSGNTVELSPEALDRLGARPLLGNLERDLNGDEIALGLGRLEAELKLRAPVLMSQFQEQARRLRPTLKTDPNMLSEFARKERLEVLAHINSLCMEALDIAFNAVALGEALPEYEARCPFRGLESFRVEDHEFFFGREELTQKLVGKIKAHSFLAVLGASGSGKSSLVMAGMIPALDLDYAVIRPGTNPLKALESAHVKSLLVVDQFEELFTLTSDEKTRANFISALLESTKSGRVIITLRSDFLGEVGAYRSLSGKIQNHLEIIPPMNADELRRAMEEQARWARLEFEADLSQQILDDVAGEPGAMPLLQHALWELWNRRHGRHLRADEYRAFGAVKEAITSTAEKVYDECSKSEQEQVRDIFLRLTRLDEGDEGRDTRRRVPLGDLIPSGANVTSISMLLDKLANARLIVKTVQDGKIEIEVAHEALIRHWERLRIWLNEDRDNLRLREGINDDARRWENASRDESLLNHRGPRLELALAMSKKPRYRLNPVEQAYLDECVGLREREKTAAARRRRYTIAGASVALVVIIAILLGWGITNGRQVEIAQKAQENAEEQAKIARAGELAAQAQSLITDNFQNSLLLGIEAIHEYDTPRSRNVLLDGVYTNPQLIQFLTGHSGTVNSVAFSPDGKILASGNGDNTVTLWDVKTRQSIGQLTGHTRSVNSVAFSPDGKTLASGSDDNTIILWDVESRQFLGQLTGNSSIVTSIAFSPDAKILASSSYGAVILWDMESRQPVGKLSTGQMNYLVRVVFSPDGKTLVSGSDDNVIILWDVENRRPTAQLTEHQYSWPNFAFSPDGKILASSIYNNTIILWDIENHQPIGQPLIGHTKYISSISFSPDGKVLASSSYDNTVILWDVGNHQPIGQPLIGHNDDVTSVAFSPDGKTLVSGSFDNTIILWTLEGDTHIYSQITGHRSYISSVAFSPDGKTLASGSHDNTIILWNVMSRQPICPLVKHNDIVTSVAFSPDGKTLASGSDDSTVILWDVKSCQLISQLTGHTDGVTSVAFSPDGNKIASGGLQGTIILWDMATYQLTELPLIHEEQVNTVVFSPDSKLLVSGGGNRNGNVIILWDLEDRQPFGQPLIEHQGGVSSLAFSPGGDKIASGSFREVTIILWDVTSHQPIGHFVFSSHLGEHALVESIAFSPDGRTIASGNSNNTITLWDVKTYLPIGQLTGHSAIVNSVAFSPDGKILASGSDDNSIILWDVDLQSWINKSCQRAGRNFTREEWKNYGFTEPYRATCPQWPIEPEPTPTP